MWTGEEGGEKVVMIMGRRGRGEIGRPSSGDKKNPPGRLVPSPSILPLFPAKVQVGRLWKFRTQTTWNFSQAESSYLPSWAGWMENEMEGI